jgi:hypothetical protein
MKNKRWTPRTDITDDLLKFREKRKWQIALRRYVLQKQKCPQYAPYFGTSIDEFRSWIEMQFDTVCNWENFGEAWQFDHIVPLGYFDFDNDSDLKLCWNFVNIRVEPLHAQKEESQRIDVLAAKPFFARLYAITGFSVCQSMVEKIARIENSRVMSNERMENYIAERIKSLETFQSFTTYEYELLNTGTPLADILAERELIKKFGG